MKKLPIMTLCLALCACGSISSDKGAELKTCLTQQAYSALSNGTLTAATLKETAKTIATTCLKQQNMEKMGLTEPTTNTAEGILKALQAAKSE